jgi:CheY-like chemotaxis protein
MGVGSTFWFTIRLAAAEKLELPPLSRPEWRGMKVLLVEKSETQRDVLAARLTEWGFEVEVVPEQRLSAPAQGYPYHLAIIGPMVDHRPAIDAARPVGQAIATLLLLRSDQEVTREQLRAAKLRGYITQPLRQSQMSAAIAGALSATPAEPDAGEHAATKPAARSPYRILLADDHEVNQLVVVEMLDEAGFDCTVVSDGQQACDALSRASFDLILMDCQMPVMDGLQATRVIRQREQSAGLRRLPIIALTANPEGQVRTTCLETGMDGFCTKPIDRDRLIATVKHFLPESNANMTATERNPIDLETVLRRCSGKTALADMVIEKLISQAQAAITGISDALGSADASAAALHAHGLKGAAGMAGATDLHAIAARLESLGKSADLSAASAELQSLRAELARCAEFIADPSRRAWPAAPAAVNPQRTFE